MDLTDQQLMLLEQICYIDKKVLRAAKIDSESLDFNEGDLTVEKLLSEFTEDKMRNLEKVGTIEIQAKDGTKESGYAQGSEWAAIIRAIKEDEDLASLKISGVQRQKTEKENEQGPVLAICYTQENHPDEAIVAFTGTTGRDEWVDNVIAMNQKDTRAQNEALEYVDALDYENITVVGHSKGGNKAQYAAVKSDKVNRCISMDGQGFSEAFADEYRLKIAQKGGCITNYSLSVDFVHGMLFPVSTGIQVYCRGEGMESVGENHSSLSYFHFTRDEKGRSVIRYDGDNKDYPLLIIEEENAFSVLLKNVLAKAISVMPDDRKIKVADYLGHVVALLTNKTNHFEENKVVYCRKNHNVLEYILSDPQSLVTTLYYIEYAIDYYGVTTEELVGLMQFLGLGEFADEMQEFLQEYRGADQGVSTALNVIGDLQQLMKFPYVVKFYVYVTALNAWLKHKTGKDYELDKIAGPITASYLPVLPDAGAGRPKKTPLQKGKTFDFAHSAYNGLMDVIGMVEAHYISTLDSWDAYSSEEWYDSLLLGIGRHGIQKYEEDMKELCRICRNNIDRIFKTEYQIDQSVGQSLQKFGETIQNCKTDFEKLTGCL